MKADAGERQKMAEPGHTRTSAPRAPRRTRFANGSLARSGASAWTLRSILREWVAHFNGRRPHSALGPGVPGPPV